MFKFHSQSNFFKKVIEWGLITVPPLLILLLVPIQPNFGLSSIIWGPAIIGFVVSLIKIIYYILRVICFKKITLRSVIRPSLTIVIYIFAMNLQQTSRAEALLYARSLAIEIQKKCDLNVCPQSTEKWSALEINKTKYKNYDRSFVKAGKWWTQYALTYTSPNKDNADKFTLFLYIDIDTHFTFIGGNGVTLTEKNKYSQARPLNENSY